MKHVPTFLVASLLAFSAADAAGPPEELSFDDALSIGSQVVKAATARGHPVGVVVVNREGRVIVALRMDGVSFLNLDVAQAKAVSAGALGISTDVLGKAVEGGQQSLLAVPGLMPIGGGVPIMRSGRVIAGIGVSGGTPEDDKALAEAAVARR